MCELCDELKTTTAGTERRRAPLPEGVDLTENADGTVSLTMPMELMKELVLHAMLGRFASR